MANLKLTRPGMFDDGVVDLVYPAGGASNVVVDPSPRSGRLRRAVDAGFVVVTADAATEIPDPVVATPPQRVYVQEDDPGEVGTGALWVDTSDAEPVLKVRNADDDDWTTAGGAVSGISDVPGLQVALDAKATPADIAAVVGAAPGALNTLDELAAALGDDENLASTITTALAGKVDTDDSRLSDARRGLVG